VPYTTSARPHLAKPIDSKAVPAAELLLEPILVGNRRRAYTRAMSALMDRIKKLLGMGKKA